MPFYDVDIAIDAGHIICLDEENREISDGTILIKDDQISYIGQRLDKATYQSKKHILAPKGVALPPFFNQHTHPSLSVYRGLGVDLPLKKWLENTIWPLETEFSNPDNVYLGTQLSILEMIRGGIGAVATMDFFTQVVGKAFEGAGIRAFLGEAIFKGPTPCCSSADEAFSYTRGLYKEFANSELIQVYCAVHAPFTSTPELYAQAAELARSLGIKTTSHIAETKFEVEWCLKEYGMTPVELVQSTGILDTEFILIHGVHLSDRDIQILKENNIPVIHNPHSNMVLGSGVCRVPDLLKSGIRVGLGTDSAASNNGLSMLNEMQTMAKLHKVFWKDSSQLPAHTSLEMATKTGYDIYSMPRLGQLKEGWKADLQLIDLDEVHTIPNYDPVASIVYSSHQEDVNTLIVNGKILMEDKKILDLDEESILKECKKLSKDVKSFLKNRS